jgi:hypothetical protein
MTTAKDIQRLEAELAVFIRAEDPEAVRRVYRELLSAGKSRHEVMAEMIRASTELQGAAASPLGAQPNGSSKPQRETEPNIAERTGARRLPDSSAVPDHLPVTCQAAEQTSSVGASDAVHSEVAPRGDRRFGPGTRHPVFAIVLVVGIVTGILLPQAIQEDSAATGVLPAPNFQQTIAGVKPEPDTPAHSITTIASKISLGLVNGEHAAAEDAPLAEAPPNEALPLRAAEPVTALYGPPSLPPAYAGVPSDAEPALDLPSSRPATIERTRSSLLTAALMQRGDALFALGDVAAARLYYERAADAGEAQAAVRLGGTYDPAFLARFHFKGPQGNISVAAYWYQRARELGASEAVGLLEALSTEKAP